MGAWDGLAGNTGLTGASKRKCIGIRHAVQFIHSCQDADYLISTPSVLHQVTYVHIHFGSTSKCACVCTYVHVRMYKIRTFIHIECLNVYIIYVRI